MMDRFTIVQLNGKSIMADRDSMEFPHSRLLVTYEGRPVICRREKGNTLRAEDGRLIYAPFAEIHGVIGEYYK